MLLNYKSQISEGISGVIHHYNCCKYFHDAVRATPGDDGMYVNF